MPHEKALQKTPTRQIWKNMPTAKYSDWPSQIELRLMVAAVQVLALLRPKTGNLQEVSRESVHIYSDLS